MVADTAFLFAGALRCDCATTLAVMLAVYAEKWGRLNGKEQLPCDC